MKNIISASLLLALAICACVSAIATDHEYDGDQPKRKTGAAYDAQGYQAGKRDNRQDVRSAVMLQEWQGRSEDQRRYDDYRRAPQLGGGSAGGALQNWQTMSREMGYQDGINDGLKDYRTGHSYRPTQGDNYKSASRGYSSRFGGKDVYKQFYREGYANGYQRGYYNNPSGGRR